MNHFHFPVSFGTILVSWNGQGLLTRIEWSQRKLAVCQNVKKSQKMPPNLIDLIDRIRGYFYQGIPLGEVPWHLLDQEEWSFFQREVYGAISKIPHGETRTYGWVAEKIGRISASRAVGQALRKNPLPILIPCHRILGSNSFGGFMGTSDPSQPELQLKRKLMQIEEDYLSPTFSFFSQGPLWKGYSQLGTSS